MLVDSKLLFTTSCTYDCGGRDNTEPRQGRPQPFKSRAVRRWLTWWPMADTCELTGMPSSPTSPTHIACRSPMQPQQCMGTAPRHGAIKLTNYSLQRCPRLHYSWISGVWGSPSPRDVTGQKGRWEERKGKDDKLIDPQCTSSSAALPVTLDVRVCTLHQDILQSTDNIQIQIPVMIQCRLLHSAHWRNYKWKLH